MNIELNKIHETCNKRGHQVDNLKYILCNNFVSYKIHRVLYSLNLKIRSHVRHMSILMWKQINYNQKTFTGLEFSSCTIIGKKKIVLKFLKTSKS